MTRAPNATAGSLLGFLHTGPMSGWDLFQVAQRVIGEFWSVTRSQVYRELGRLAEDGLVEVGERGPRDRRPYALTDAGREAFLQWLDQDPGPEQIRFPLLLTMSFGRHLPPERLAAFVEADRLVHEERLARHLSDRAAAERADCEDPWAMATLDFGIRYETAVMEWFAHLPEDFRRPGGPGPPEEPRPPLSR
jgi:DNA-binding PadR family transcriptional regulator